MHDHNGNSTGDRRLSSIDAARRLMHALGDSEWESQGEPGLPRIRGYVLLRKLGEGGGGEVYQAVKTGADRLLALKLLKTSDHSDAARDRAWRELSVLSEIRSPFVPRVHEYGIHEGRLFIVTDFVDGLSLESYFQSQNLDRRAQVKLLARLATVVQTELHEHGVIHRDLKPSNILIDRFGQPVVIDLGIAQIIGERSGQTMTGDGSPIGTPAFMAPEQARGERRVISTRTDVYSLGAIAMQVLIGRGPHPCDIGIHELIRRVAQEPAGDPRSVDPTLPKSLAGVIRKATAFEPERRYQSAGDLAADLERWLHGEPVKAVEASLWQQFKWFRKRRKGLMAATLIVAIGIAGAVSGGAQAYFRQKAEELAKQSEANRQDAETRLATIKVESAKLEADAADLTDNAAALQKKFLRYREIILDTVGNIEGDIASGKIDNASKLIHGLSLLAAIDAFTDEELLVQFQGIREELAEEILMFLYSPDDPFIVRDLISQLREEPGCGF
jgi:hypothetical protein